MIGTACIGQEFIVPETHAAVLVGGGPWGAGDGAMEVALNTFCHRNKSSLEE